MQLQRTLAPDAGQRLRRIAALAEPEPLPEDSRRSAARATVIVGLILEGISDRYRADARQASGLQRAWKKGLSWLLGALHMVWGVVELLVPRSFLQLVFQYWVWFILTLGILLLVLGNLYSSMEATNWVGWAAVGLAVATGAACGVVRRLARKPAWRIAGSLAVILLTLALMLLPAVPGLQPRLGAAGIPLLGFVWISMAGFEISFRAQQWLARPQVTALLILVLAGLALGFTLWTPASDVAAWDFLRRVWYVATILALLVPACLATGNSLRELRHKLRFVAELWQDPYATAALPGMRPTAASLMQRRLVLVTVAISPEALTPFVHRLLYPRATPAGAGAPPPPAVGSPATSASFAPVTPAPRRLAPAAQAGLGRIDALATPAPQRLRILTLTARTLTILGSLFETNCTKKFTVLKPAAVWIGRAGFILGLGVHAANRASIGRPLFRHWFWLAFGFAATLSALALLPNTWLPVAGLARAASLIWGVTIGAGLLVGSLEWFISKNPFRTRMLSVLVAVAAYLVWTIRLLPARP